MHWTDDRDRYVAELKMVEPGAVLLGKESWFWLVLGWVYKIISFGIADRRAWMEYMGSTFGPIVGPAVGARWLSGVWIRHEGRHVRQYIWCSVLGLIPRRFWPNWLVWLRDYMLPWVGLPVYGVIYGLVAAPLAVAYGRFLLEIDAEIAAQLSVYTDVSMMPEDTSWMVAYQRNVFLFTEALLSRKYWLPILPKVVGYYIAAMLCGRALGRLIKRTGWKPKTESAIQ